MSEPLDPHARPPYVPAALPPPHLAFDALQTERLRWVQKMEALGRLGAGVAHDINNHLTLVLGRTQLLLERGDLPTDVRGDLRSVARMAESVAELMRDWLALGHRERTERRTAVDLNAVVAGLVPMLQTALPEGVTLTTDLRAAPAFVRAERGPVEQLVINLALNARDAMPGGGTLMLATALGTLGRDTEPGGAAAPFVLPAAPGDYVVLAVRDTGCGIDAPVMEHMFDPFFTTKEPGQGSGMGLYTVREIVRAAGGTLRAASALGRGSRFEVYLPRAAALDAVPPEERAARLPPVRETVLVLGGEAMIRELVREVLARDGYNVTAAAPGPEVVALCLARPRPLQLLIFDSRLTPVAETTVRRLTARYPTMKTLRLGNGSATDALGACPALPKPFAPPDLIRAVRQVLDDPSRARSAAE